MNIDQLMLGFIEKQEEAKIVDNNLLRNEKKKWQILSFGSNNWTKHLDKGGTLLSAAEM